MSSFQAAPRPSLPQRVRTTWFTNPRADRRPSRHDLRRHGELFFASTNELMHSFDYADDVSKVVIDLSAAHVWDSSAVATLDAVTAKFTARGIEAEIIGLNPHSEQLHTKLSGQLT